MAWLFELAIECGDEERAGRCARHFESDDAGVPADVAVERSADDGAWWAIVVPRGESRNGVTSTKVAHSLSIAGHAMLERLRTAPPFRFAVIGVEAFEGLTFDELSPALGADPWLAERFDGLVVSDLTREKLGPKAPFEPFELGYSWFPYRGERYDPPVGQGEHESS